MSLKSELIRELVVSLTSNPEVMKTIIDEYGIHNNLDIGNKLAGLARDIEKSVKYS